MKRLLYTLWIALALTACSRATPTPVAMDSLLFQAGDLPEGYSGAQLDTSLPALLIEAPAPGEAARQLLEKDGVPIGEVALQRYRDQDTLFDAAGEAVVKMPKDNRRGIFSIGDWSYLYTTDEPGKEYSEMVFTRCFFMAYIRIEGVSESDLIIAYGKNLDKRLQEAYCPQTVETN